MVLAGRCWLFAFVVFCGVLVGVAQEGTFVLRGYVSDAATGEPLPFAEVFVPQQAIGTATDANGFFSLQLPVGRIHVVVHMVGYDSASLVVEGKPREVVTRSVRLKAQELKLSATEISVERQARIRQASVSMLRLSPIDVKRVPIAAGMADIVQYLYTMPGVVTPGEVGGKVYIRGGTPVQNLFLLDGMTVYNPYHSLAYFSVFDPEVVRTVTVYTGGFPVEYGGRLSAVVDIQTREGSATRWEGVGQVGTVGSSVVVGGPLLRRTGGRSSAITVIGSVRTSYLDQVDGFFYPYIDSGNLNYSFLDFYGKMSVLGEDGSRLSVFGLRFTDGVRYPELALGWYNNAGGVHFILLPPDSRAIVEGTATASRYSASMVVAGDTARPRTAGLSDFGARVSVTYHRANSQLFRYGLDIAGTSALLQYYNIYGTFFDYRRYTTELGMYAMGRLIRHNWIMEPGIRLQYYATAGALVPEPRLSVKHKTTGWLRLKWSAGVYSQSLISTASDREVVQLFVGFLNLPDEAIYNFRDKRIRQNIQLAVHGVAGAEVDLTEELTVNVETYGKLYPRVFNLNRYKLFPSEPTYLMERGWATGVDLLATYSGKRLHVTLSYSLAWVIRQDTALTYYPPFDRRHNLNIVVWYEWGKGWWASARWQFGTGFPYTPTAGFYPRLPLAGALNDTFWTAQPTVGILYDMDNYFKRRLPPYHRLDLSLTKRWTIASKTELSVTVSVINAYMRYNVFYVDRLQQKVVYMFPILPSLSAEVRW